MNINNKLNEYLNNKINIEKLIHYFDTNNYTEKEIKEYGIVYTPKYISDFIIKELNPNINETILEPSIGHGIFIISLIEYIENKYKLSKKELKEYFINKVFGKDIKKQNIEELKELLIIYFKKKDIKILKEELNNFNVGNTLYSSKTHYDIIVGNPPYIRTKNMKEQELTKLRENYISCEKGNIDIYYAFIEFANKYSNRSSFIVPNSFIYSTSGNKIREIIKDNILSLIDFKEKKIFENVSTYTSIFLLNKFKKNKIINYKNKLDEKYKKYNKDILNKDKWIFGQTKINKIELHFVKFHTPIATLRDKIYITNEVKNKDTIPFFKISKIKNEKEFLENKQNIIFPYKYDNLKIKYIIKKENEIQKETIKYLQLNKKELDKRDKGKTDKYESWYAYGRKQGLNTFNKENEIIIIPGMISKNYKFFSISLSKISEQFLFSSGFILEVLKKDKKKILTFLNSEIFFEYLKENGKIWKGKDEHSSYYSLSIKQIKEIIKEK